MSAPRSLRASGRSCRPTPGLRTVPGEGAWLSTVCGSFSVVVVTVCETDGVPAAGAAGFVIVVVVVEIDDVVPGGLVVVDG